jgi:hypothetical protein
MTKDPTENESPHYEKIPCVSCSNTFDRAKRGRNPYIIECSPCRRVAALAKKRIRMAEIRAGVKNPHDGQPEPMTLMTFDDTVQQEESGLQITADRQPARYLSPAGPSHGRSTFSKSLQNYLDLLSQRAATDEWWQANPHWHAGL